MSENEYLDPEETDNETPQTPKGFCHTVRHKDGGTVKVNNYSMAKAIKICCVDCMGYESDPRTCVDKLCPFFPYKGSIFITKTRTVYKKPSQEQIEKLKAGLAKFRAAKNGNAENNL